MRWKARAAALALMLVGCLAAPPAVVAHQRQPQRRPQRHQQQQPQRQRQQQPGQPAARRPPAPSQPTPSQPPPSQPQSWPKPIQDDQAYWLVLFNKLEAAAVSESDLALWDGERWYGGDYQRIWIKTEGERAFRSGAGEFELQALYSRLIAPYWDFQVGVRYDRQTGPGPGLSRAQFVIGLEGLAPYWFELEPALFISEDGDVSGRLTASYDMLLTQRLILQPWFELNLAASTVPEWGVGSGLSDASVELRLRYEFRRELAPYVGVRWFQRFGRTAELARERRERVAQWALLGGFRLWF